MKRISKNNNREKYLARRKILAPNSFSPQNIFTQLNIFLFIYFFPPDQTTRYFFTKIFSKEFFFSQDFLCLQHLFQKLFFLAHIGIFLTRKSISPEVLFYNKKFHHIFFSLPELYLKELTKNNNWKNVSQESRKKFLQKSFSPESFFSYQKMFFHIFFNRPGVAGAVL